MVCIVIPIEKIEEGDCSTKGESIFIPIVRGESKFPVGCVRSN